MTLKIKFNRLVLVFPIFLLLNILSRSYGGSFIEPLGRVTTPVPKTNAYKYITDNAGTYGTVKMCAVSPTTGALSGCVPTGSVFINPIGINIDNSTGSSLAYISYAFSFSQGIAICQVSSATGALTGCTTTGSNMDFLLIQLLLVDLPISQSAKSVRLRDYYRVVLQFKPLVLDLQMELMLRITMASTT
jgi:hypothetical protein